MTRRPATSIPGRLQNAAELAYESAENFALSLGGEPAPAVRAVVRRPLHLHRRRQLDGLVSPVGKIESCARRTSDLNITIGLALLSFAVFEPKLPEARGRRGTLGKFFPALRVQDGVGAGSIALFVG